LEQFQLGFQAGLPEMTFGKTGLNDNSLLAMQESEQYTLCKGNKKCKGLHKTTDDVRAWVLINTI
jgi:hypothetical protein